MTTTFGEGQMVRGLVCGLFRVEQVTFAFGTGIPILVVREVCEKTGRESRRLMRFPAEMFKAA